jgi:ribosomal-protein-alanine N-acetyltransferase
MASPALLANIHIERGGNDDLDAVMAVMDAAFGMTYGEAWTRSQCAGILPLAGVSLTLALDAASREVVGFALARSVADDCELLLLAVVPERHRSGVGSRLLSNFVETAREQGVSRLHLEVRDGNPAVRMYRDAGFTAAGRRPKYYRGADGTRFDALTYVRSL